MMPRFRPMVTAWARSLAPSLDKIFVQQSSQTFTGKERLNVLFAGGFLQFRSFLLLNLPPLY